MGEEKRKNPRIETNIEIMFREAGSFIKSYMINVSKGGVFIKTPSPLPIDSPVNLQMQMPDDNETMEIKGCVVWSNPMGEKNSFPTGMGIQFVNMKPEHEEKILVFVKKHMKEIKQRSII